MSTSTPVSSPSPMREGLLAGYLALAMAVGPLAHYAISALGPYVVSELSLSAGEFGWLWFVTFGIAAALTIAGGRLTDRWGPRRLLLVGFACGAVALLVIGSAPSFVWLMAGIGVAGVVQAIANPATNHVISTDIGSGRYGLVVGVKQSGVQIGQLLAGLVLPLVAAWTSWRHAILYCTGLALAGLWLTWRMRFSAGGSRPDQAGRPSRVPARIWWLSGYALLMGVLIQASNVYLPLYAHQELGATFTRAGMVAAVLGGVGVAARMAWGRLVDRFADERAVLLWLAVLAAVAVAMFALSASVGELLMWLGAALFSFSALSANVVIMAAVVRSSPPGTVGRNTGWPSLGLYVGFMLGPPLFGIVVDHLGGYLTAWFGLLVTAVLLAVLTWQWRTARPQ
ncbi:MFS transporter [Georgenia subflava]|uniref:MFS transporter n=1 Tax=Georgenia subflava TaxID=1622177 RepID=A0A6N7EAX0_9MICO|nr:MFS transporter [Georgenia subflava]MPV35532.1 MFS transporter [Georgenia subflava]